MVDVSLGLIRGTIPNYDKIVVQLDRYGASVTVGCVIHPGMRLEFSGFDDYTIREAAAMLINHYVIAQKLL